MNSIKYFDEILERKIEVSKEFKGCTVLLKDNWVIMINEDGSPLWSCHEESAFVEEILTIFGIDWRRE